MQRLCRRPIFHISSFIFHLHDFLPQFLHRHSRPPRRRTRHHILRATHARRVAQTHHHRLRRRHLHRARHMDHHLRRRCRRLHSHPPPRITLAQLHHLTPPPRRCPRHRAAVAPRRHQGGIHLPHGRHHHRHLHTPYLVHPRRHPHRHGGADERHGALHRPEKTHLHRSQGAHLRHRPIGTHHQGRDPLPAQWRHRHIHPHPLHQCQFRLLRTLHRRVAITHTVAPHLGGIAA